MEKISLPTRIDIKEESKKHGVVTIEPCYPGYGITISNALRRVLLSSLPGAAVTAFKIKGVQYEFSNIPGVKEDVVEIMMNLKQLSLRVYSDEPVELALKIKGEKVVRAGDIEKNADVEIVNPELVICNMTEKSAELEMKIWVERGLGYVPVEERKGEKPEIGVIQVDSLYTPVQKVGVTRENVRVGERTDYDKLTLDIETDGTITVKEAIKWAAEILVEQFGYVATFWELGEVVEAADEEVVSGNEDEKKEIRNKKSHPKAGEGSSARLSSTFGSLRPESGSKTAETSSLESAGRQVTKGDDKTVEIDEAGEAREEMPEKPKKRGRPKKS